MTSQRQQTLERLLAELDNTNEAVKQCLDILEGNAHATQAIIFEIIEGAESSPFPLNFDMLNEKHHHMFKEKFGLEEANKDEEGLNIFDEDFEEKIIKKNEKVTSSIKKSTIPGPFGEPIDIVEIEMGEDMTEEEIAKEIAKHMKGKIDSGDEDDKNEGTWS